MHKSTAETLTMQGKCLHGGLHQARLAGLGVQEQCSYRRRFKVKRKCVALDVNLVSTNFTLQPHDPRANRKIGLTVRRRSCSDRRRLSTSRGARSPSSSIIISEQARSVRFGNAKRIRAKSRHVRKERSERRRTRMFVPRYLQPVSVDWFRMVKSVFCPGTRWIRVPNCNSKRFGRMLRTGMGGKSLGWIAMERTRGLRCGFAWRKSQNLNILSLFLKRTSATIKQRARGRRLRHVREKLCSVCGWSPEWPMIRSMTSQGNNRGSIEASR